MAAEMNLSHKRFLQYPDDCHRKNKESILRMCAAANMMYEATNDQTRLHRQDYDYLWLPMFWVSPDEIPAHVKILYGPHHSIFPEGNLIGPLNPKWAKRAVYTTLSDWNLEVFKEFAPQTTIPTAPLMFGVNPAIDDVRQVPKELDCLVYFKRRDPKELEYVQSILQAKGLSYRIFKYGSYDNAEFMRALKKVRFAIWLGTHESQGFAFQETLASNVPILCWDAMTMFDEYGEYKQYKGRKNLYATTATVWSSLCGERILRAYEVPAALDAVQRNLSVYEPRKEILNQTSDTQTMAKLLNWFSDANRV